MTCQQAHTQFQQQSVITIVYIDVSPTFGTKSFSLSKSNFVGNRDLFLGIAFLALGGGCVILLIIFLAKWIAEKRDRQKFDWTKIHNTNIELYCAWYILTFYWCILHHTSRTFPLIQLPRCPWDLKRPQEISHLGWNRCFQGCNWNRPEKIQIGGWRLCWKERQRRRLEEI